MSDDAPYIIAAFFGIALLITYIIMAGMSDVVLFLIVFGPTIGLAFLALWGMNGRQ